MSRASGGSDREASAALSSSARVSTGDDTAFLALDALGELQAGHVLSITRTAPSYAKGWLEHMVVPEGGVDQVPDYVRQTWGGGTFVLQWKQRGPGGGLQYARGNATIHIAGDPLYQGRRYNGGQLEAPASPSTAAPQPVIVQQPVAQGVSGNLQDLLTTLLRRAVEGKSDGGSVVELIKAIRELEGARAQPVPATATASPFGELEGIDRVLNTIAKLRKLDPARDDDDDDEPASPMSGMFGGGGVPSMEQMFMMKMMADMGMGSMGMPGGMQQQQQQQPQQQQVPPGHVWHPQRGWIPYAQPTSAPTTTSTTAPTSAPTSAPSSAPTTNATDDDSDGGEYFDGPLSSDEVAEHVAGLPDAERERFLLDVLAKLGIDAGAVAQAKQAFTTPFHVTLPTGTDDNS